MYLSYYQLDRKPFQISTDPKFLWLGEKHKEALAVLRYGLMDNKGFLLLTGDVGTGKTTLINALVNTLGEEVTVATLLDPGIEKNEFFAYLGKAFHMEQPFTSKGEFVHNFTQFLNSAYDDHKKVLLIIDESQRLSQELLEEIRLLSNIEKQSTKLINIFFVGQIEFNSIILQPHNSALRQRIGVNYDLQPLTEKETAQYVHHRLKIAGAQKRLFSAGAIKEVYRFSNGYPRLINVICDRALVTGFTTETKKIGSNILKECAKELKLQTLKSKPIPKKKRKKEKKQFLIDKSHEVRPSRPRSSTIENILYTLLVLLIAAWLGIAIFYYYPILFSVDSAGRQSNEIRSSSSAAARQTTSAETTSSEPTEKINRPAQSLVDDNKTGHNDQASKSSTLDSFEIPDKDVVIQITFDLNNELTTESIKTLDSLSHVLRNRPTQFITVKGYSKSQGSSRYNKKMSEFTANIVKGYLMGKGVPAVQIETVGTWLIHADTNSQIAGAQENKQWAEIQFINSQ